MEGKVAKKMTSTEKDGTTRLHLDTRLEDPWASLRWPSSRPARCLTGPPPPFFPGIRIFSENHQKPRKTAVFAKNYGCLDQIWLRVDLTHTCRISKKYRCFLLGSTELRLHLNKVPQLGALFKTPCFGWEGSPTKIDYRRKGTLILASPLEDLVNRTCRIPLRTLVSNLSCCFFPFGAH